MSHQGIVLALMAGSMAALASVSAKFATSYDESFRITSNLWGVPTFKDVIEQIFTIFTSTDDIFAKTVLMVRLCGVIGILLFNGLMWTLFTKSLQFCSSSVEATVTNTGANFLLTAVVGHLLFKEQLPLLWWVGSTFILIGLLLIHKGGQRSQDQPLPKKKTS